MQQPIDQDELGELAAPYQCDADMDATEALLKRHHLSF